jgi:hypothetical protein
MVEQEVLDLLADAAPLEPEKVQLEARLAMSPASGAGVTRGAATGLATAALPQATRAIARALVREGIVGDAVRPVFKECNVKMLSV